MQKQYFLQAGGKKTSYYVPRPLFHAPMPLCLGFIAANAAAGEAVRMAARARRARQLVGKEILLVASGFFCCMIQSLHVGDIIAFWCTVVHATSCALLAVLYVLHNGS